MAETEADYERRIEQQTEALEQMGFGPAVDLGGDGVLSFLTGRTQAATCLACGALVLLPRRDVDLNPLTVHRSWHSAAPEPGMAAARQAAEANESEDGE